MPTKPVIFSVDDDPNVLQAVVRDLRTRYGDRYRIMRADSGGAALEALRELKRRSESVALFVADQRMPQMNGVEFLTAALRLFPDAKRVLLTAYADTDAAINAINTVAVHYYLLKPWDPPEEKLYPVLDDLLEDWLASLSPAVRGHPHHRPPLVARSASGEGISGAQPGAVPVSRRRAGSRSARSSGAV